MADLPAANAPTWPLQLLNLLARRVHRTGRAFGHGHWWQGMPGVLRPHADWEHLVFARDPQLAPVTTPAGSVEFLQCVAATAGTIAAFQDDERAGRGDAALARLLARAPLLISRTTVG
jgi:hypothetical protein